MVILVTGGAGYIGSHTVLELLNAKQEVIVLDNLSNASEQALKRVELLANKKITFYQGDILDGSLLEHIFTAHPIDAVIHFAGVKAVAESVSLPVKYYHNNVTGTLNLLQHMLKAQVYNFLFSSTATVYGNPAQIPVSENCPVGKTENPYATSKLMVETILTDLTRSQPKFNSIILRYFNPIGAHESGLIGEDPNGIPNNLLPYISQVAIKKLPYLSIFGNDYDTHDGTGVRDYIHVVDLALGHLKALQVHQKDTGLHIYNLGTGIGYSVLDVVNAFAHNNAIKIPFQFKPRRSGDIDMYYSSPKLANKKLNWKAERDLNIMMIDTWRWQKNNPNGYKD